MTSDNGRGLLTSQTKSYLRIAHCIITAGILPNVKRFVPSYIFRRFPQVTLLRDYTKMGQKSKEFDRRNMEWAVSLAGLK